MGGPKDCLSADQFARAARARSRVSVSIRVGDLVSSGTIHDMSISGARIDGCPLRIALGTVLILSPSIDEERESTLWIRASVVRLIGECGLGVRFVEMDPATKELIERLGRDEAE